MSFKRMVWCNECKTTYTTMSVVFAAKPYCLNCGSEDMKWVVAKTERPPEYRWWRPSTWGDLILVVKTKDGVERHDGHQGRG